MPFEPGEVVAPSDPRIVLEGQWGQQPGVAITVNSGSRISFSFAGESVQLLFDTAGLTVAPHLWITIDDRTPPPIDPSPWAPRRAGTNPAQA